MADKFINATALLEQMPEVPYKGSLRRVLMQAPAAEVQPVRHGRWARMDMHRGMEQYKCSVCQSECYVPECMGEPMYAYCPNCGANMIGGTDGD